MPPPNMCLGLLRLGEGLRVGAGGVPPPREGAAAVRREGLWGWGLGGDLWLPSVPLFRWSFQIIHSTNASPGRAKDMCAGFGDREKSKA